MIAIFTKQIIKLKSWIQLILAILINSDIFVYFRMVKSKSAVISSSPLKNVCVPGLNCYSCPSAQTSCPIGALQNWLNDVRYKLALHDKVSLTGLYILGFLSLVGTIGGRISCGWICPFGFLQDIIYKITKKNFRIPQVIKYFRYVSLVVFVIILPLFLFDSSTLSNSPWFCKVVCPAGTLEAGLPLLAVDATLRKAASFITLIKMFGLALFIASFFLSRRVFCKTTCPLGAFWGFFNKISLFKLKLNKVTCLNCKKCEEVCPMNIKVLSNLNSTECIRCMECVGVCPNSSLTFGIATGKVIIPKKLYSDINIKS